MRKPSNRPTDAELAILRALWKLGPTTVRQVYEALAEEGQDTNYPAVLRMMQLMADKGMLARDESERSHIYRPAEKKEAIQGGLVDDMLERVFGGNALHMLAATLSRRKMSAKEREEVARLFEQVEKKGKK
jgi:BlaI family transcriptional regulator, penicillinase repressor